MMLGEGRSGRQEAASAAAIALTVTALFTIDAERLYTHGNFTYVLLPLSICVSLLLFLVVAKAMERSGNDTLTGLFRYAFGGALGVICSVILVSGLLLNSFLTLSSFVSMAHSFVYIEADYIRVTLWLVIAAAYLSFSGLEIIARISRLFGIALAVLVLIGCTSAAPSWDISRLYPIPGRDLGSGALDVSRSLFRFMPIFAAMLSMSKGFHGVSNVRKACVTAGIIAAVFTCIVQLAISLTYSYPDLARMYSPLFRLNMMSPNEGDLGRLDKIDLFLWVIGGIISAGLSQYASGLILIRSTGTGDHRPVSLMISVLIASLVLLQNVGLYDAVKSIADAMSDWGFIPYTVMFIAVSVTVAVRQKRRNGRNKAA